MSTFGMTGLRPDQGPPLSVTMSFFVTAPLAIVAAGLLLLVTGGEDSGSVYSGFTLALVHLGTLGFLLLIMLGALYQMLPVVAGALVPAPRLAHGVHGLVVGATVALVWGLARTEHTAFLVAFGLASAALAAFLLPAGYALVRTRAIGPTTWGMRLALLGLLAVALLGLRLAWGRGTFGYTEGWFAWRHAHAHLGLICWVGMLTAAVSWQVVPMFYLAAQMPAWSQWAVVGGVGASLLGLSGVYFLGLPPEAIPWCVAPGALAVWLLHPLVTLNSLRKRKRKRRDPSLWFWNLAMLLAPVVLVLSVAVTVFDRPYLPTLYGFVALWGWAGALVHGMLTRIVPFLVWLHRCSKWVGLRPVPAARALYPDRYVTAGLVLHGAGLIAGMLAIYFDQPWLWRLLGALLVATAGLLTSQVLGALFRAPRLEPS